MLLPVTSALCLVLFEVHQYKKYTTQPPRQVHSAGSRDANAKLTDRRLRRAPAANPASDQPGASEAETLGGGSVERLVRPSGKPPQYGPGKELVDLPMPRNRLRHARARILIPIVLPAMSDENTSHLLDPLHEVPTLHATSSSATLRTAGMCPPDKSAYKSRRCSCRS